MQGFSGAPRTIANASLVAAAIALILGAAHTDAARAAEADAESLTEITVTGSRIVRRDLDAASPVVTVETQAFEESSTLAVETVLNQLPQFTPANTQFVTSDTFVSATNTPGISTVSMRGLGANRTLVLIDGRRGQPVNSTLVIDTNTIPSSALESVEIMTGGASATYGADALAGVTNFKLRSNFEGMDLQYRYGISERGDGVESRISMLLGSSLADGRGNAMIGMEWSERGEVMAVDRPFFSDALSDSQTNSTSAARMNRFQYEPSTTNMTTGQVALFQSAANGLFPERPAGYNVPVTTPFLFNTDASVFKQERQGLGFSEPIAAPNYKVSPSNTLVENNLDLRYSSPLKRYSVFGKADFAINDWVEAFSNITFVDTRTRQVLQPTGAVGGFGAAIPHGTAIYGPSRAADGSTLAEYRTGGSRGLDCPAMGGCTNSQAFPVPAELAALLDARGADFVSPTSTTRAFDPVTGVEIPTQGVNARWTLGGTLNFLPARTIENGTNLYQVLGGFRGKTGLGDWTWEAYFSHGSTRTDLDYIGFASTRRFQAVVQAPNYGKGFTTTGPGSTTLTCTTGLPIFSSFAISQDCVDAIAANYVDRTRLTQDIGEVTAQGGLFELPAGQIRAAVGLTYRENDFQYYPDASREVNNVVDIPVGVFGQANVVGGTKVGEAYGELLVPVLRDMFLGKKLELELGYRYSDYDISGGVPTWKALFNWDPFDYVKIRGGYQAANRAPNINELFLDASSTAVTMRGAEYCLSTTPERTGNNPNNPNRVGAQQLCEALIGNSTTPFSANPGGFTGGRADGVILEQRSGNRNLKSEDGRTWTLGTVLDSPFESALLSGTTLSVDYYQVKITDAISALSAQTTYDLCFNRDGLSNPGYSIDGANGLCRNIIRDATSGAALQVISSYQNVGVIETSGLDVVLDWRVALSDMGLESLPGRVSLNLSFNKLFTYKAQDSAGSQALENAGTLGSAARPALFDWRSVTTLRYSNASWDAALNWRHLPSIRSFNYVTDPTTVVQGAGSYDVFGLTGNWNITKQLAVSGGVDNLLDREPERVGAGQIINIAASSGGGTTTLDGAASTNSGYYDVLGRRYFVNVKLRF